MQRVRYVVVFLMATLLIPGAADGRQSAEGETEISLPVTIERVWYRGEKKPIFGAARLSGDLTITPEAFEIHGRKKEVVVPLHTVRGMSMGRMRGDVDTEWIVLELDRGGVNALAGLRDGRKMGYGQRTSEIYETLKAALRRIGAGHYDLPEGYGVFEALENQLTLALPEGWSWYSEILVEIDPQTRLGRTVFSAEPIARGTAAERDVEGTMRRLAGVHRGEVPAFVVDRRQVASRGMTCDGFSERGRQEASAWVRELLEVDGVTIESLDEPSAVALSGCEGLRYRARLRNPDGGVALGEVRVAAGHRFAVSLVWRGASESAHREPYERALETFRFAAAR